MRQLGLVLTLNNADKYRQVRLARTKRATTVVTISNRVYGGYVLLVRYWVKTNTVTIHKYTERYYHDHFDGAFWRPKPKGGNRPPGYSRKWEQL